MQARGSSLLHVHIIKYEGVEENENKKPHMMAVFEGKLQLILHSQVSSPIPAAPTLSPSGGLISFFVILVLSFNHVGYHPLFFC